MRTKRCPRCGVTKPAVAGPEGFTRNRVQPDGLGGYCTPCSRAVSKEQRARNVARNTAPPLPPDPLEFDVDVDAPPAGASPPAPPTAAEVVERSRDKRVAVDLRAQVAALVAENERLAGDLEGALHLQVPPPPVQFVAREYHRSEAIPLILASDWHVEEVVDLEKVSGLNEYNPDIARRRAENFFRNACQLVRRDAKDSEIRRVILAVLGDTFTGSIHPELVEVNAMGPSEAARFAQSLLAGGFRFMLEHLPGVEIEAVMVDGNHGRMTEKTRVATRTENSLESFMYHSLAAQFVGEPRVRWTIARGEFVYVSLFDDFLVRFFHGDQFNYQGGVGGLTIPLNKKIAGWDRGRRAKLSVMGHWHQRLDGGNFLVNGSLIGASAYSQRIAASPEEPQQQYALIHSRNGGTKAGVAPIWVD